MACRLAQLSWFDLTRLVLATGIGAFITVNLGAAMAQSATCIIMSEISSSVIESDIAIRVGLRNERVVHLYLDRGCPQLAFHQQFTFRATRGRLCVAEDYIVSRSGDFCRIEEMAFSYPSDQDPHEITPGRPDPDFY